MFIRGDYLIKVKHFAHRNKVNGRNKMVERKADLSQQSGQQPPGLQDSRSAASSSLADTGSDHPESQQSGQRCRKEKSWGFVKTKKKISPWQPFSFLWDFSLFFRCFFYLLLQNSALLLILDNMPICHLRNRQEGLRSDITHILVEKYFWNSSGPRHHVSSFTHLFLLFNLFYICIQTVTIPTLLNFDWISCFF